MEAHQPLQLRAACSRAGNPGKAGKGKEHSCAGWLPVSHVVFPVTLEDDGLNATWREDGGNPIPSTQPGSSNG